MDAGGVVGLDDEVIEVATDLVGGAVAGGEGVAGNLGTATGQQAELDAATDDQLLLHALPLDLFLHQSARACRHDVHDVGGELRSLADHLQEARPVEAHELDSGDGHRCGAARPGVEHRHLAQHRAGQQIVNRLALHRDRQLTLQQNEHGVARLALANDGRARRQAQASIRGEPCHLVG